MLYFDAHSEFLAVILEQFKKVLYPDGVDVQGREV